MNFRKFKAVEKFLASNELPSCTLFIRVFVTYYVILLCQLTILMPLFEKMPSDILMEYHQKITAGRKITEACAISILMVCFIKESGKVFKILSYMFVTSCILLYIYICVEFVKHIANFDPEYALFFVWRFLEVSFFSYMTMLAVMICRMKKITPREWKTFDIYMLVIAILVFTGTVFQKVLGAPEFIIGIAVLLGAIALSLKLARLTCEHNVLALRELKQ